MILNRTDTAFHISFDRYEHFLTHCKPVSYGDNKCGISKYFNAVSLYVINKCSNPKYLCLKLIKEKWINASLVGTMFCSVNQQTSHPALQLLPFGSHSYTHLCMNVVGHWLVVVRVDDWQPLQNVLTPALPTKNTFCAPHC